MSKFSALAGSKTARDTYWVFGSNFFTSFLAFLYTLFLARILSPEGWGIFSAVIGYMLLVSDVGDLGIGSSLSSFLPPLFNEHKISTADSFTKTAFYFQAVILLLLSIPTILFARPLAELILKQGNLSNLMVLAAFGIISSMLLTFITSLLTAEKKFSRLAIVMAISTVVKLLLVIIFFSLHRLDLKLAVTIFAAAPLMSLAYYLINHPPHFLSATFSINNLRKLLSFSIFLGLARIFSAVSGRLDALMIIPLSSSFTAGIYQGAFKFASLYILLAGSFSQVIAPRLASIGRTDVLSYLKKIIGVVVGLWITMIITYFIAPILVVFTLGEQYRLSVPVFQQLLLPMALFIGTIPSVNYLIYALKKPFVSTINTLVQLVIVFTGNLYFIPKYGSLGPVRTLTVAYALTLLIATYFAIYYHRKAVTAAS